MLQLRDLNQCTFLVELQLDRPYPSRGSDSSTWEVNIGLLLYFFLHGLVCAEFGFLLNIGDCSIALPGQGAIACQVPVIFHPICVAEQEYFWHVQAA